MDWISDAFEWVCAAYFVLVVALLPFALAGGILYLVRTAWGIECR